MVVVLQSIHRVEKKHLNGEKPLKSEIQTIIDKSFGTYLHFWLLCAHARCEYNFTYLTLPSTHHATLKTSTSSFTWFSTLYWVGRAGAMCFKKDSNTFFQTSVVKHRWFITLHKCPKEFCPRLYMYTVVPLQYQGYENGLLWYIKIPIRYWGLGGLQEDLKLL